jgi:hypothetical protein
MYHQSKFISTAIACQHQVVIYYQIVIIVIKDDGRR